MPVKRPNNFHIFFPLIGLCFFVILYIASAFLYPGGNEHDRSAKGFSWQHNYWCDVLEDHAENGKVNTARPVAITAMFILAVSLALFWYHIPKLFNFQSFFNLAVRGCGILSMAVLPFLFTGSHDTVINTAGVLGATATILTLAGLYKIKLYKLFLLGIICIILFLLNNYIYYTKNYLVYLAGIQKITFILFLVWFGCLNILLYKKLKPDTSHT